MKPRHLALLALGCLLAPGCVEAPTVVLEPLSIISWVPSGGAVCVDSLTTVVVSFSDEVIVETLQDKIELHKDPVSLSSKVSATPTYDNESYAVTVTPDSALQPSTTYWILVKAGITGVVAEPLPVDLHSKFTTIDSTGCLPP
jgi:hypothetical protein